MVAKIATTEDIGKLQQEVIAPDVVTDPFVGGAGASGARLRSL